MQAIATARFLLTLGLVLVAGAARADDSRGANRPAPRQVGPWNLDALSKPPRIDWIQNTGLVRSLYYAGVPYRGKNTRVFAYFGMPANAGDKRLPAMVLVHGGGGTAFAEWAELWARRGYVCIAMDLSGRGPDKKRLPDGGPNQSHTQKFDDIRNGVKDAWPYHAVANVVRAVSLLRHHPNVDPNRIGITGISWGGYLTSIVCGVDNRLKAAVPVYGCGFLHENSTWLKSFERLGKQHAKLWVDNFDPSRYLARCRMPTLWVNGTNDFAYPLDSYRKSYSLVKGPRTIRVTVKMPHGHRAGWAPKEIGWFIDSIFLKSTPLPKVSNIDRRGATLSATFESPSPVKTARLHYTTDAGPWQKREWKTVPATIDSQKRITARLGKDAADQKRVTAFFTLTDQRGATVSTEHIIAR